MSRQLRRVAMMCVTSIVLGIAGCSTGTESGGSGAGLGSPLNAVPADRYEPTGKVEAVPELPKRVAYLQSGDAEVYSVWADAMRSAAKKRDLEFVTTNANFNETAYIDGMRTFLTRGVGAMLVDNLYEAAERPVVREAMDAGVAVFTTSFGPATTQMFVDQYANGKITAKAMIDYINKNLGGKASILHINQDNEEANIPFGKALRDEVAAAGDNIKIAVDVVSKSSPREFGFQTMNTVLQSNPEVNVVVGQDEYVLGAMAALEAAGKAKDPRWLFVGYGGTSSALQAVAKGTSPLKIVVVPAALPLIGVIPSVYGADWLAGRSIPSVATFPAIVIDTAAKVNEYQADMKDPEAILGSAKQDKYVSLLGSISYATRMAYYDGNGVTPNK